MLYIDTFFWSKAWALGKGQDQARNNGVAGTISLLGSAYPDNFGMHAILISMTTEQRLLTNLEETPTLSTT